jgi:MFS family permease
MLEGYRRAYSLGAHCPALFPPRVEAVEHVEAVDPSPPDVGVHPALTLLVLLVGTFMTSMDVAIVNVAGPSIQGDLHMSGASLQLVISGYTVAYAALLVTGARMGDDLGHRRVFLAGVALFTGASLACGLAWSPGVLIAARIVQGVGAAALAPQVITVIQRQLAGSARARALGIYATVISLAAVAGQIIGGGLITANVAGSGWRPIFLINVPIGIVLMAVVPRVVPATRGVLHRRQDPGGVALLSVTAALLLIPLVLGREVHWAVWTWASLAACVPLGWALARHLRRLEAGGGDPLFQLSLLRRPGLRNGMLSLCAQMLAYGGFLFTLTLLLQQHHHYSPIDSGLTFGPYAAGFAFSSVTVGRLHPVTLRRAQIAGLMLLAASDLAIGLLARNGQWPVIAELVLLLLAGAGFGAGFSPAMSRVVAQVPADSSHHASGLLTSGIQLSYALGVTTLGSYYLAGQIAHAGRAFAITTIVEAGLAVAAAFLLCHLNGISASDQANRQPRTGLSHKRRFQRFG